MYSVYVSCCSVQPANAGNPRGTAKIRSGAIVGTIVDQPNAIETPDLSPYVRTGRGEEGGGEGRMVGVGETKALRLTLLPLVAGSKSKSKLSPLTISIWILTLLPEEAGSKSPPQKGRRL